MTTERNVRLRKVSEKGGPQTTYCVDLDIDGVPTFVGTVVKRNTSVPRWVGGRCHGSRSAARWFPFDRDGRRIDHPSSLYLGYAKREAAVELVVAMVANGGTP